MTTKQVADKLVKYCREGKWHQAQSELYAQNIWSQEPSWVYPRVTTGLKKVFKKSENWSKHTKLHDMKVSKPTIAGNWISLKMSMDIESKEWGRRKEEEICMYRVQDGKIVEEQFFYG